MDKLTYKGIEYHAIVMPSPALSLEYDERESLLYYDAGEGEYEQFLIVLNNNPLPNLVGQTVTHHQPGNYVEELVVLRVDGKPTYTVEHREYNFSDAIARISIPDEYRITSGYALERKLLALIADD